MQQKLDCISWSIPRIEPAARFERLGSCQNISIPRSSTTPRGAIHKRASHDRLARMGYRSTLCRLSGLARGLCRDSNALARPDRNDTTRMAP